MSFEQKDLDALLNITENSYLKNKSEDKYNDFRAKDPFPSIHSALLNSEDIIKYITTTGMIDEFIAQNLDDATYTCIFSGTYLRYGSDNKPEEKILKNDEELIIKPNSITYLQINETIRVPLYMVLRFNLKVKHVYKGLLLGTGPIVDPGFVGKLNIPLHNLTTNEYVIKKGAKLIDMEFTKLSIKNNWKIDKSSDIYKNIVKKLVFSNLPLELQNPITPNRKIDTYIEDSLKGNDNFHKEPKNILSVGSSLAEMDKTLYEIKKTKKKTDRGLWIGGATLGVTVLALIIPLFTTLDSIHKERVEYRDSLAQYQETVDCLEKRIVELEIEDKIEKLDLLKKEYESFSDKQSVEAVEINNQITNLKQEITELQKKMQ